MLFGAHCSTSGGFSQALQRAAQIQGDICQIFVKNNMRWFGPAPAEDELGLYQSARSKLNLSSIFGHAGYLINLGAPASKNREISIRSLIQELEFAALLELPFLVIHPGAHLGAGEASGLEQITAGLNEVISATKGSSVRIALENTAGQGSCLGNKLEHLAALFDSVDQPKRLGICLDTAHLFAAGYDIRRAADWDRTMDQVSRFVGLEQVLAFHLNDSKTALGSRVDRHAHIGEGLIGKKAFIHIVNDPRFTRTPGCLETPKSKDLSEDVMNLKLLRSLVKNPNAAARSARRKVSTASPPRGKSRRSPKRVPKR